MNSELVVAIEQSPRDTVSNSQVSLGLLWIGFIAAFVFLSVSAPKDSSKLDDELVAPEVTKWKKRKEVAWAGVKWGAIMLWMWLLDDRQILPIHSKYYNRDLFLFILAGIFLAAGLTLTKTKRPGVFSRDQSEEFKGWMQITFLLYHYFAAKEYYNLIRVLIAAYVWMTGYGNYSYFIKYKDYSFWRVCKMLFRLNFLVLFFCLTMNTDFVLYYICPMHTLWFLSVWILMAVKSEWNESAKLVWLKFAIYFVIVAFIWEIPEVFDFVWGPWKQLLETNGSMHEWKFRSTLDHWSPLFGMICAWAYPHICSWFETLESHESRAYEYMIKGVVSAVILGAGYAWFTQIFLLEKFEYNALHPYYSIIPILVYLYIRNVMPTFRNYHLSLLETCGKITLETYLCQFHMWMCRKDDAYVGGLVNIVDGYPLINFMVVTAIYIGLSQQLFDLTTVFSTFMIPQLPKNDAIGVTETWAEIKKKWGILVVLWAGLYCGVAFLRVVITEI
eukprot:m.117824 g.117824  ORF g.117824 m.117824 type:complete len:501 (+) comp28608_c0_seq1:94-1596(+)